MTRIRRPRSGLSHPSCRHALPAIPARPDFPARLRGRGPAPELQPGGELYVTQSAISHHIQKLEAELGAAVRTPHARRGADAGGQAYYERVHAAFELLRQGTEDIRAPQRPRRRLRIGLLSSFATRWLAPRLPAFSAAHPDIELQLQPDIGLADVAGGEVDAAIRYGRGPGPACARAS